MPRLVLNPCALESAARAALAVLVLAVAARADLEADAVAGVLWPGEGRALSRGAAIEALAELGPAALPALCDAIAGRGAPAGPAAQDAPRAQPAAPAWERCEVALAAIGRMPAEPALAALRAASLARAEPYDRLAQLRALAATRDARAGELALEVLERGGFALLASPRLAPAASEALVELMAAAPGALERLAEVCDRLAPEEVAALATCFARLPAERAFPALTGQLGRSAELDVAILRALARVDPRDRAASAALALESARAELGTFDTAVRRQAVALLGEFAEHADVPDLIYACSDRDPVVRASARRALAGLAGRDLGGEAAAWKAWHAGELDWYREVFPGVALRLASPDAGSVVKALRDLGGHRAFRREIAAAAVGGLGSTDAGIAAATCDFLAVNGSCSVLAALVARLEAAEKAEPSVAAAAERALASLAGTVAEGGARAWRAWLERAR